MLKRILLSKKVGFIPENNRGWLWPLWCLALSSCISTSAVHNERGPSSSNKSSENVELKVFGKHRPNLPGFETVLENEDLLKPEENIHLEIYLRNHLDRILAFSSTNSTTNPKQFPFALKLIRVVNSGKKLVVKYQQFIERQVGKEKYGIPVEGGTVLLYFRNGRLKRVNSFLMPLPELKEDFLNPGFEFAWTENELASFMDLLKSSEEASQGLRQYLEALARRSQVPFDYLVFLNRTLPEQREILNRFFSRLGRVSTSRILIDLARTQQLSLVRHGRTWMLQMTGMFNLPVQFDLVIPKDRHRQLEIRNLRTLYHRLAEIHGFESPLFPGGKKLPNTEKSQRAVQQLKKVVAYFDDKYSWSSFAGKGTSEPVEVHTQLKSLDFRENASWYGPLKKFLIGQGGENLQNLDNSISVLGHEYSHAIVEFSSKLVYRGDAGAINEHFADIQGMAIAAKSAAERAGDSALKMDYTIGSDIISPAVIEEKQKLFNIIIDQYHYRPEEVQQFSLNKLGLRHIYAPILSFASQYDQLKSARQEYPDDCQPSVDNDNCGVHSVSGVPNKAAALMIGALGIESVSQLIFETVVNRLNEQADLEEYAQELYQACLESQDRNIQQKCDIVISSFAAVGVDSRGTSEKKTEVESSSIPSADQSKVSDAANDLLPDVALSPELKICGRVVTRKGDQDQGDYIIRDGQVNPKISSYLRTGEVRSNIQSLKPNYCACVTGQLQMFKDPLSKTWGSAFAKIKKVEKNPAHCSESDLTWQNKSFPIEQVDLESGNGPNKGKSSQGVQRICGWVSVNTKRGYVRIVDNHKDPVVFPEGVSGFSGNSFPGISPEDYQKLQSAQCVCLEGIVHSKLLSQQHRRVYYLESLQRIAENDSSVLALPPAECVGVRWHHAQ